MPANTKPIFSLVGDIQFATSYMVTANNGADLTGVGVSYLLFTAQAQGSFVSKIRLRSTLSSSLSSLRC